MITGKETQPRQLLRYLAAVLLFANVAALRAEERLTTVWSNHLAELNQRVPAGFVVVTQPPFASLRAALS